MKVIKKISLILSILIGLAPTGIFSKGFYRSYNNNQNKQKNKNPKNKNPKLSGNTKKPSLVKKVWDNGVLGYLGDKVSNVLCNFVKNEKTDNEEVIKDVMSFTWGQAKNFAIRVPVAVGTYFATQYFVNKLAEKTGMNDAIIENFGNSKLKSTLALAVGTGLLSIPFTGVKNFAYKSVEKFNNLYTFAKIGSGFGKIGKLASNVSDKLPWFVKASLTPARWAGLGVKKVITMPAVEFGLKQKINSTMTNIAKAPFQLAGKVIGIN